MRDHDSECYCGRCREDREDSPRRNEWNLPHGVEPHNPDNLTPEQITEGGKWRAVTLEELDGRHGLLNPIGQYWADGKWWDEPIGNSPQDTIRVPITTPLPAVKESLTPQPAPAEIGTPRVDAYIARKKATHGPYWPDNLPETLDFARTLETELTAALAERDEARRLLGEAKNVLADALLYCPVEADADLETLITQITNHLKTA